MRNQSHKSESSYWALPSPCLCGDVELTCTLYRTRLPLQTHLPQSLELTSREVAPAADSKCKAQSHSPSALPRITSLVLRLNTSPMSSLASSQPVIRSRPHTHGQTPSLIDHLLGKEPSIAMQMETLFANLLIFPEHPPPSGFSTPLLWAGLIKWDVEDSCRDLTITQR